DWSSDVCSSDLAADLRPGEPLVEAGHGLAGPDRELGGRAGLPAGVELLAGVPERALVVQDRVVALLQRRAVALDEGLHPELVRRAAVGERHLRRLAVALVLHLGQAPVVALLLAALRALLLA